MYRIAPRFDDICSALLTRGQMVHAVRVKGQTRDFTDNVDALLGP